jgi:hypothetical protein
MDKFFISITWFSARLDDKRKTWVLFKGNMLEMANNSAKAVAMAAASTKDMSRDIKTDGVIMGIWR